MHTVVETPEYQIAAKAAGMTEEERDTVLDMLQKNPMAGDVIRGSGGLRKVRVAKNDNTGKSGGYRVITYFMDMDRPVYLVTVLNKTKTENLTKGQTNDLYDVAKTIKKK